MNVVNLGFSEPSIAQNNSNIPTNENVEVESSTANSTFDQMLLESETSAKDLDSVDSEGLTEDTDENDVSQRRKGSKVAREGITAQDKRIESYISNYQRATAEESLRTSNYAIPRFDKLAHPDHDHKGVTDDRSR